MVPSIPASRLVMRNRSPERPEAEYVLYWMTAQRRTRYNYALQHALALAERFRRSLLVFEPLRVDHPWAGERFHAFVLDGMRDNATRLAASPVGYFPYVEAEPGESRGLLAALSARACVVVTDEFPCFFLPSMLTAAADALPVRLVSVDGNGLAPLRATDRAYSAAVHLRRHFQRILPTHLSEFPLEDPISVAEIPPCVCPTLPRWPSALRRAPQLARLPIDHAVGPVSMRGGQDAASSRFLNFLKNRLPAYLDDRQDASQDSSSGVSPYLHFGHLSPHEIVAGVLAAEGWEPTRLGDKAHGGREGWWGLSAPAEGYLDQVVTWRELGFNNSFHLARTYDRYEGQPGWALQTLERHASDPRPVLYGIEQLARAETNDPLWNAAQRQLLREGRIHNYLRMLWGKRVLEWTAHPRIAFDFLVELNNRYALDGRDPNSWSGISWVFGRYDHPWPPERPIFGTVRLMRSERTARKMDVSAYLERYGD